jgi:hypothetical protein
VVRAACGEACDRADSFVITLCLVAAALLVAWQLVEKWHRRHDASVAETATHEAYTLRPKAAWRAVLPALLTAVGTRAVLSPSVAAVALAAATLTLTWIAWWPRLDVDLCEFSYRTARGERPLTLSGVDEIRLGPFRQVLSLRLVGGGTVRLVRWWWSGWEPFLRRTAQCASGVEGADRVWRARMNQRTRDRLEPYVEPVTRPRRVP